MKKKFLVEIPLVGSWACEVDADSREAAIEAAWEKSSAASLENDETVEWEFVSAITTGNVLHASLNEICVTEVKPRKSKVAR